MFCLYGWVGVVGVGEVFLLVAGVLLMVYLEVLGLSEFLSLRGWLGDARPEEGCCGVFRFGAFGKVQGGLAFFAADCGIWLKSNVDL